MLRSRLTACTFPRSLALRRPLRIPLHVAVSARSGPGPQAEFRRGVVALHHFEYEDANETFQRIQSANPGFAMAYWGEAMTYHQTLWRNENVGAARAVLQSPGADAGRASGAAPPPRRTRHSSKPSMRCSVEGDSAVRRTRYAEVMGALYARNPEDPDVASFYALALLGTMSRSLIGYVDSHEGHSASLAGSETQRRVAEVIERVLNAHPQHPGALHYLLHNLRRPRAREAGAASRAHVRDRRARVEPCAAYAGSHLRTTRLVAGGCDCGPRGVRGFRRLGQGEGPGIGPAQLPRAVVASIRVAAAGTIPRGVGDARSDRADGQSDRRPGPAERVVVDARTLCRRDAPLGCARARAQLRQRQRAVRHRRQRSALGQRFPRGARAPGARDQVPVACRKATSGPPSPSWSGKSRP